MNEEFEIKVIIKDPEKVEAILRSKAKFIKEKKQKDEYFVPNHEDFFSIKPTREYLRVRHEDGKDLLSYNFCHIDKDGSLLKTDEYETKIEDPKIMSIILRKLDMEDKVTVTKDRKFFDYKNCEVVLDHIEELGYFLEIEAESKKRCNEILDELGIEWEKAPNMGYPDMVLKKIR